MIYYHGNGREAAENNLKSSTRLLEEVVVQLPDVGGDVDPVHGLAVVDQEHGGQQILVKVQLHKSSSDPSSYNNSYC